MHRSLTIRLAATGLLVTLTACTGGGVSATATTTAPSLASPATRLATFEDLTAAVVARSAADGSATAVSTSSTVVNGDVIGDATSTTETRNGRDGASMRVRTHESARTPLPDTDLLVFPDAAYVSLRPGGVGPYHLLDPAATDLLSMVLSQMAATARDGRMLCGTELGRSTLTGVTPGELDGRPVSRYALTVDLGDGSAVPMATEHLRRMGLTALHLIVEVDRDDRLLRCTLDEELPGGRMQSETRFSRFGEPVTIERPATDQITTAPPS